MVVSKTAEADAMALPGREDLASTKRGYCWAPAVGSVGRSTTSLGLSSVVDGYAATTGLAGMLFAGCPVLVFTARLAAVVAYWPHDGSGPAGGALPLAGGV